MSASVVKVTGISSQTSEKEVRDFFSFCGKISDLSVSSESDDTKSAKVTFEKETAAKTALLLDNTTLGPASVHVTSESAGTTSTSSKGAEEHDGHDVSQEDKPRARILAEYLAHGYLISDSVIEKGLALDKQHGISERFTTTLLGFNDKYKVTDKSRAVDDKYALSSRAGAAWNGLSSYFDKTMGTPTGQKLRTFYEQGSRQVMDVHNEARHLANLKAGKTATGESSGTKGEPTAEEAEMEKVGDSDRTKCNCGATTEKCPCAPGKCACSNCAKNTEGTA